MLDVKGFAVISLAVNFDTKEPEPVKRKYFDDEFWFINIKIVLTIENIC